MPFPRRNPHRTGLRSSFTLFLRKGDFFANLKTVEVLIQLAVARKIDLTPVCGLEKAETLFRKNPGDAAAR